MRKWLPVLLMILLMINLAQGQPIGGGPIGGGGGGISACSDCAASFEAAGAITTHAAVTTSVHGITNTANLYEVGDEDAIAAAMRLSVEDHGTDTTVVLTEDDLNKVHLFSNTATCTVSLPSIDADNVGSWIEFRKKGAGNLVINGADSDTIFTTDDQISNTNATPEIDYLTLFIETANHYGCKGMFGAWTTSVQV